MAFIHEDLGEAPILWMKNLPFDYQLSHDVYLCHGTPKDDLIYLLERVQTGHAELRKDQDIVQGSWGFHLVNASSGKVIATLRRIEMIAISR